VANLARKTPWNGPDQSKNRVESAMILQFLPVYRLRRAAGGQLCFLCHESVNGKSVRGMRCGGDPEPDDIPWNRFAIPWNV
jgi:hypothetical protein